VLQTSKEPKASNLAKSQRPVLRHYILSVHNHPRNKVGAIQHGWLKGVNSNSLHQLDDIGKDGASNINIPYVPNEVSHPWTAHDAMGFSLGYYDGDYKPAFPDYDDFLTDLTGSQLTSNTSSLYNGNISHMATTIADADDIELGTFTPPQCWNSYQYDRLKVIPNSVNSNDRHFDK
jgi:hypothetical protein